MDPSKPNSSYDVETESKLCRLFELSFLWSKLNFFSEHFQRHPLLLFSQLDFGIKNTLVEFSFDRSYFFVWSWAYPLLEFHR